MNTKARNQIRAIPADSAELTLYRNQRITVLADDLINLNAQINNLIDTEHQSTELSLADMTSKLNIQTLNLQNKVIDKLNPSQLYDETEENSFVFEADQEFCGLRTLGIKEVALTEIDKNLTQKDLESGIFTWLPDNTTFGANSIKITPALETLNISSSDLTISSDDTSYTLAFENTLDDTNDSLLGYNKVTESIILNRAVLSSEKILNNIGEVLQPDADVIGFSKVIIPANSDAVTAVSEIAIPTSEAISNINLEIDSTNSNCSILTEKVSSNWLAGPDVFGTRVVNNYQQTLGTYILTLPQACITAVNTFSSTFTHVDNNTVFANTITYTDDEVNTNNYYTILSTDKNKALAAVKIPNTKVIPNVTIAKETLTDLMSEGEGKLVIKSADNTVFSQVTINYDSQITYGSYLDLITLETSNNLTLATADTKIEYTIVENESNTIYSPITRLPNFSDPVYAFESADPYIYFKIDSAITGATLANYKLVITQQISEEVVVDEFTTTYNLTPKETVFDNLVLPDSVKLKDDSILVIKFLPKNNNIILYGIRLEDPTDTANNDYVFAPILVDPFKDFKQINNGLLSYKFELLAKDTTN